MKAVLRLIMFGLIAGIIFGAMGTAKEIFFDMRKRSDFTMTGKYINIKNTSDFLEFKPDGVYLSKDSKLLGSGLYDYEIDDNRLHAYEAFVFVANGQRTASGEALYDKKENDDQSGGEWYDMKADKLIWKNGKKTYVKFKK